METNDREVTVRRETALNVTAEGHVRVWLVEKAAIRDWIVDNHTNKDSIHCFEVGRHQMIIGADWRKWEVLALVNRADRIGIVFAEDRIPEHPLRVIADDRVRAFAIGLNDRDLVVMENHGREQ